MAKRATKKMKAIHIANVKRMPLYKAMMRGVAVGAVLVRLN